jgi:hypothetical protein
MAANIIPLTHWAVLIGVGVTISRSNPGTSISSKDRSLQGAGQDIIAVSKYLESALSRADINILTATKTQFNDITPTESSDRLPSRDNVTSAFKRILDLANPGAHVYIHYAGHGTRRKHDGAVALELINQDSFETEYLYGTILRTALRRMIQNGLSVTLVLDCCFSGIVLRASQGKTPSIRYIEHDHKIDDASEYTNTFADVVDEEMREGAINLTRLLEPEGYTIIAACGPQEVASELEFANGVRRGALSYFLVDSLATLRRRGIEITNQMLHQHLRAQFHACLPEQTPMLYGNLGFSFFGDFAEYPTLSMVSGHRSNEDGDLILHAGEVHGVHHGDEYALHLTELVPESLTINHGEIIRVETVLVDSVTSRIKTTDSDDLRKIKKGSVWKASLVASVSPRRTHVELDKNFRDKEWLVAASQSCRFLVLTEKGRRAENSWYVFHVAMNAQDNIEIQNQDCKTVCNFGPIPATQDGNTALLNMLDHISRFKFFEGIENQLPSPSFEKSFQLTTAQEPNKDGFHNVEHESELALMFQNLSDHPLYLAIFIITEFWEVRNMVSERGEDTCLPVFPKSGEESGMQELPLAMSIPQELQQKGQKETEDIVKIFITRQSSMFPGLVLPKLGHNDGLRGQGDPLQLTLNELSNTERTGNDGRSEWTTRTYFIRTYI